jgi:hypothetical protein
MALKDLVTDLGSFYENNPFAAEFKSKAGPTYAQKYGFNQRSLRYGEDRPGDGSSREPFITTKIPAIDADLPSATGLVAGITREVDRRKDDLKRITTFLTTPKGLIFIAKQEILSSQNPIVPGRPNRSGPLKGFYNPLATLAQVGVSGTGLHFNKQGKLLESFDDSLKYEAEYVKLSGEELEGNRLKNLYYKKINPNGIPTGSTPDFKSTAISEDENFLISYKGGPGITQTVIPFASNRVYDGKDYPLGKYTDSKKYKERYQDIQGQSFVSLRLTNQLLFLHSNQILGERDLTNTIAATKFYSPVRLSSNTPPSAKVYDEKGNQVKGASTTTYSKKQLNNGKEGISTSTLIGQDFRRKIDVIPGDLKQRYTGLFGIDSTRNYTDPIVNKIQRVGLGDPGKRTRNRSNLYRTDADTVDKVGALPLYTDVNVTGLTSHSRDFIRFRFEVLSNKKDEATFVHFRAFLGAITDNFGGTWDSTKYVGRGDTFYNYTGFTRTISLSFKVHPQSREEMKAMYQKLTYLASTLAPDYSGAGGYMKGNITRLTIGSYFYRIPGFITSLTYTVPEDASWEIAFDQPEGGQERDQMETPRHFEVQVGFTPIHDFAPQIMDGTRNFALFTPDQKNHGQPNPYIPENEIGNAIEPNGEAALSVVNSIKGIDPAISTSSRTAAVDNLSPESTINPPPQPNFGPTSNTGDTGNAFGDTVFGPTDPKTSGY